MEKIQFRVLYREFLFRIVDLELLSSHAQGDASRLLGQFAAFLVFISFVLSLGALDFGSGHPTPAQLMAARWKIEHSLVSIMMVAVGVLTVLSWDSTFPDRRDLLVLGPLPVRRSTLFFAKCAAMATALGVTV